MEKVSAFALAICLCMNCGAYAESTKASEASDMYLKTLSNLQQVDVSTYTEITIHAPAKVIWGYLTDERMAKYSPAIYHLDTGTWGEVGSVYSIFSVPTDGGKVHPFPKVRQKVIDSIPYKYFVLRCSSQASEGAVETFAGYDVFVLEETNGITKLIFVQPLAFGNLNLTKEEVPLFKEGQRQFIKPIFEQLKRLVESEYKP